MNEQSNVESSNVIYEQTSPDGQIYAWVEQDDRVAYFYLASDLENFETKACWVRNLIAGPMTLDQREMAEGLAPTLPRTECHSRDGLPPLDPTQLSILWFEEGNAAALIQGDETLAIIPPGSGLEGFHGFAQDCKNQNPICWPMPDSPQLQERLDNAGHWWQEWMSGSPWKVRQAALLKRLEAGLGAHQKYFSIDGQKWPPKGLALFQQPQWQALVTVGVSLRPQPNVELVSETPRQFARFELALLSEPSTPEALIQHVGGWLSGMTNYPWYHQTWLGHGHTSSLQLPSSAGDFPFVILVEHGELLRRITDRASQSDPLVLLPPFERLALPPYRECLTNLLWAVPITPAEQQVASTQGSSELLDRIVATPHRLLFSMSRLSAN